MSEGSVARASELFAVIKRLIQARLRDADG
jgi:hypothetical protein